MEKKAVTSDDMYMEAVCGKVRQVYGINSLKILSNTVLAIRKIYI